MWVVARRRRAAAEADAFRLGAPGHDWHAIYVEPGPKAAVGATAKALDADSVERTVQLIGSVGGLLADRGFQVCRASALTEGTLRPSLLAWVDAGDTAADERRRLGALACPAS